ncbi:MAG: hypothetical protein JO001_00205 [Alphaproteobacteria bacterium]|nr:hypothetical protein [Alphaproteobacteria bacterium]
MSTLDRDKLAKLCGMLGSAHDGKNPAAGLAANRLARKAGLSWHDVFGVNAADATSACTHEPNLREMTVYEGIVFARDHAAEIRAAIEKFDCLPAAEQQRAQADPALYRGRAA